MGTSLASQSSHLNNALFYYLRRRAFLFFHSLEEEPFPPICCFCGPLKVICTSIWSSSSYRTLSTARCNPHYTKQQSKDVPTIARQPKQVDRVGESSHVVEHFHVDNSCNSVRSQNEPRNRDFPGKHARPPVKQVQLM